MGVAVYLCEKNEKLLIFTKNYLFFSFSLFSFWTILVVGYFKLFDEPILLEPGYHFQSELIGITFAGTMPFLLTHSFNWSWYKKTAHWLSEISYTLYLTHFPLLTFFFFVFTLPESGQPSLRNYLIIFLLLLLSLIYAFGIWYLFERRTTDVRNYVKNLVHKWNWKFKNA